AVFRPKTAKQEAVFHETTTTEVYYMLEGAGTLVTGGTLADPVREAPTTSTIRASRIDGGVSRRVVPGDVILIPGGTTHWWSELNADIKYLIVRPILQDGYRSNRPAGHLAPPLTVVASALTADWSANRPLGGHPSAAQSGCAVSRPLQGVPVEGDRRAR